MTVIARPRSTSNNVVPTSTFSFTGWYDAAQTPVHRGVYWRQLPGGPFSCWNGGAWYGDASSPSAAALIVQRSPHQKAAWRGLVSPAGPDAVCGTCRGKGVLDRGFHVDDGRDLIEPCPDC